MSELAGLGLGSHHPFPSLGRFRAVDRMYFVLGDPSVLRKQEHVLPNGSLGSDDARFFFTTPLVVGALTTGVVALSGYLNWVTLFWAFVFGSVAGFFAFVLWTRGRAAAAAVRAAGQVIRVEPQSPQAWEMCILADMVASTSAWRRGFVDRDRLLPGLAWRYVTTSLQMEGLQHDVGRASEHQSLAGIVGQKLDELTATSAALDGIRGRLQHVLESAQRLDQREQDRWRQVERRREEEELRRRLSSGSMPVMRQDDDELFAGAIATEAQVLNELLAESDRIISGLG
jgi:hypothetical protein